MPKSFLSITLPVLFALSACVPQPEMASPEQDPVPEQPYGFLDMRVLELNKSQLQNGDTQLIPAFDSLLREAEQALQLVPPSVMDKETVPPSGNKHDYTSMSPYWWPNPDTEDGLPYIRKDGVVNPERNAFDKVPGSTMSQAVTTLSLAYYFTDDEKYAEKAAGLLHTWFLDEDTYMTPHLEYGQFVPGRSTGRSVGIIESRNFVFLTDYERLLLRSDAWSDTQHENFSQWMEAFLAWLLASDLGKEEASRPNNHGSWCEFQILALSQFSGSPEKGCTMVNDIGERRITKQIKSDGSQPEELERTKSFAYSVFNLDALVKILQLAENDPECIHNIDVQIDHISSALNFLLPYVNGEKVWPYTQITGTDHSIEKLIPMLAFLGPRTDVLDEDTYLKDLIEMFPESRYLLTTEAVALAGPSAN